MPHVTEEIWSQLPDREGRLIVSPWPEANAVFADDAGALDRVQEAARIFRRSGVQVELGSDDERRIFAAVVRPERARVDDKRDAEIERLRKEVTRAEGMLANERFVGNAPPEVVEAEREKLERYRRGSQPRRLTHDPRQKAAPRRPPGAGRKRRWLAPRHRLRRRVRFPDHNARQRVRRDARATRRAANAATTADRDQRPRSRRPGRQGRRMPPQADALISSFA
jgi:valyl-tRNA synthetase